MKNSFYWVILLLLFFLGGCTSFVEKNSLPSLDSQKDISSKNGTLIKNDEPLNKTFEKNHSFLYYETNNSFLNNSLLSNETLPSQNTTLSQVMTQEEITLIPTSKIYIGAFMDFNNSEDVVNKEKITTFQNITHLRYGYAYFSNNFYQRLRYPNKEIHEIISMNLIPFVRLMPRSSLEEYTQEKKYTLENIIDGKFDEEIKQWAYEAKKDYEMNKIPLLVDFAGEMNGDWFPWSSHPQKYKRAYRHIIDLFREENVTHITWFFHVNIESFGNVTMNDYYPGDDYIDWIGVSIYGALTPDEEWISFEDLLKENYKELLTISKNKPLALLEFGVVENHPQGNKAKWLQNAFETILKKKYVNFSIVSYWSENWENEHSVSELSINSSTQSLHTYQYYLFKDLFTNNLVFLKNNKTLVTRRDLFKDNSSKVLP